MSQLRYSQWWYIGWLRSTFNSWLWHHLGHHIEGTSYVSPNLDNVCWKASVLWSNLMGQTLPTSLITRWCRNEWMYEDVSVTLHMSCLYSCSSEMIRSLLLIMPSARLVWKRMVISNFDVWCSMMKNTWLRIWATDTYCVILLLLRTHRHSAGQFWYIPVGKCEIWRRLQEVFIEDFLKTSPHLWEQSKPLTRGTSSGLHSSRLQDRCRRLQDVFIEDFLKTSPHLWEQSKPLTRGTSSGLSSSRLHDRCRRLQDVFSEHLLKTSSYLWEQLKPVTTGTSSGLPSSPLQDRCRRLQYVFIEDFLKTSSHLWEQLKPVTTGTSSGLPSSPLQDRCTSLQYVFIEDFLKTSSHLWEQLKPVTMGTSSGLPSSRLQDRCKRLQYVFIEDFLKTSSHLWEQSKPLTRGTSSGLPSSRLPDRYRRPQDVFIKDFIKDLFTPLWTIKPFHVVYAP